MACDAGLWIVDFGTVLLRPDRVAQILPREAWDDAVSGCALMIESILDRPDATDLTFVEAFDAEVAQAFKAGWDEGVAEAEHELAEAAS